VYEEWRILQKNSQKVGDSFKLKETEFINKLNNLFDIAHVNALNINEKKRFVYKSTITLRGSKTSFISIGAREIINELRRE